MSSFTGTVSLIGFDNIFLAVIQAQTLMVGQTSEVVPSIDNGNSIGDFEYLGSQLSAYSLNTMLLPMQESSTLSQRQFCVGLKTSQEKDDFVILCSQFEQIELSDQTHSTQQLPQFMCKQNMPVEGVFQHEEKVCLMVNPDQLLNYINSSDVADTGEVNHA